MLLPSHPAAEEADGGAEEDEVDAVEAAPTLDVERGEDGEDGDGRSDEALAEVTTLVADDVLKLALGGVRHVEAGEDEQSAGHHQHPQGTHRFEQQEGCFVAIDALHAEQGDDDGGDEGRGHEVEHTLASQAFVDGLRVAFQHFV